ncbi:Ribonucleoside-diphosphate reductase subunit M2 B [Clydaea vesicula]|uniref:Ribonucleoside-diphosphate reductase subunit M2 B n=1 Tax=Clydaea vesicula TaxID=447962 RepID=A0AAD5Y3B7_9FUNG|nr:Ribonucleoside-diphosphate reductase subunit M2 B [Clydaea vesicula]
MLTAVNDSEINLNLNKLKNISIDANWEESNMSNKNETEQILRENNKRFVLFPIEYNQIWESYKNSEARFWSAEEVELSDDAEDFNHLTGKEKATILQILSVLVKNGSLLGTDIFKRFNTDVQAAEARAAFGFQIMQTNIHTELFSVLLELFLDGADGDYLIETINELPSDSRKEAWIASNILESQDDFATRLTCLAVYFKLFLSTPAVVLIHFQKENVLPGLIRSISKVYRDWMGYYKFAILLLQHLTSIPSQNKVEEIIREAISIEEMVLTDISNLSGGNLFINGADLNLIFLKNYIRQMGRKALLDLGYAEEGILFENDLVGEDLDFVERLENMLEAEARKDDNESDYPIKQSSLAQKSVVSDHRTFSLDDDF